MTLSIVATAVSTAGSNSATAYQPGATRQRIILRNRPISPVLPSVSASTTIAARKGPKLAIGFGKTPSAYGIHAHQDNAYARTKKVVNRWRLIKASVRDIRLPFRHVVSSCIRLTQIGYQHQKVRRYEAGRFSGTTVTP